MISTPRTAYLALLSQLGMVHGVGLDGDSKRQTEIDVKEVVA